MLVARGNIEEAQFVRAGRIVGRGRFDGIPGILEILEVDAFDNASVLDVKTGNDPDLEHKAVCATARQGVQPKIALRQGKPEAAGGGMAAKGASIAPRKEEGVLGPRWRRGRQPPWPRYVRRGDLRAPGGGSRHSRHKRRREDGASYLAAPSRVLRSAARGETQDHPTLSKR